MFTSYFTIFPALMTIGFRFVRSILGFTVRKRLLAYASGTDAFLLFFDTTHIHKNVSQFYKIHLSLYSKVNLQALCFTRCVLVGSEAGEGPALFTATTRNWYSALSFRSGTFASSWSPGTSIAFSQSGLNL